jgi:hypothetical protein
MGAGWVINLAFAEWLIQRGKSRRNTTNEFVAKRTTRGTFCADHHLSPQKDALP